MSHLARSSYGAAELPEKGWLGGPEGPRLQLAISGTSGGSFCE